LERERTAARNGSTVDAEELDGYVEGVARQAICGGCRQNATCPKDGLPKVLSENREALQDYSLMKTLGGVPLVAGGLEDQPSRKLRLFQIIAGQVSANESRMMKAT
jgi:hypothetical protein